MIPSPSRLTFLGFAVASIAAVVSTVRIAAAQVPVPEAGSPVAPDEFAPGTIRFPPGSCVLPLPPQIEWPLPSLSVTRDWIIVPLPDLVVPACDERDLVLVDLPVGGVGDDATFCILVQQFLVEAAPRRLCVLAHQLHVQATRRLGTVWTIEGEPFARLHEAMTNDPWPLRRALALVALSKDSGSPWRRLVEDRDPLVRAAAARWLKAPAGVTESQAASVVDALLELARSDHAPTRAVAARAVGPWLHDESRNAALVAIAERDPDPHVRQAALEGLLAVRSLSARAIARRLAIDDAVDPETRSAARAALTATGIELDP